MNTFRIQDVLKDKILVSRESARLLEKPLETMMAKAGASRDAESAATLAVDFEGIDGIAPSFLDELLSIFESVIAVETNGHKRSMIVEHPPTRLSLKFEAIARGHGMSIQALPNGSWVLTDNRKSHV